MDEELRAKILRRAARAFLALTLGRVIPTTLRQHHLQLVSLDGNELYYSYVVKPEAAQPLSVEAQETAHFNEENSAQGDVAPDAPAEVFGTIKKDYFQEALALLKSQQSDPIDDYTETSVDNPVAALTTTEEASKSKSIFILARRAPNNEIYLEEMENLPKPSETLLKAQKVTTESPAQRDIVHLL